MYAGRFGETRKRYNIGQFTIQNMGKSEANSIFFICHLLIHLLNHHLQKNGRRTYKCDGKLVELSESAVQKFIHWNTDDSKSQNVKYDAKMINVLLVRCVRSANLKKADVSEAGRAFIRGSTINILLSSI